MGYVYIHTNKINGKKYVGQTTLKLEVRWGNNGSSYKGQVFYSAIQKYGWKNFEHEVFEICDYLLDFMEIYLIQLYDTMNPEKGYNCESGGNKNKRFSEERNRRLSEARKGKPSPNKGKKLSEERKRKNSETHKGLKHSEESKRKISIANKGRERSEEQKRRMSEARKGKHPSEEHRRKNSETHRGHCVSEETKKKIASTKRETMRLKSQRYKEYKSQGGELKWNEWCKQTQ